MQGTGERMTGDGSLSVRDLLGSLRFVGDSGDVMPFVKRADLSEVLTAGMPVSISAYIKANVIYVEPRRSSDAPARVRLPVVATRGRLRSRPRSGRARRTRRVARPASLADPPPGPSGPGPAPADHLQAGGAS
jgi:hypothetical protein